MMKKMHVAIERVGTEEGWQVEPDADRPLVFANHYAREGESHGNPGPLM